MTFGFGNQCSTKLNYFPKTPSFEKFMIYKYLLEMKYRFLFSFISWSFLVLNCYFFKATLLYVLMKFSLAHRSNDTLYFLITNVTEVFITYLQLSYFLANQITFLFICYQIFAFISAGFYKFEYVYFKNVSLIILIFWVIFVLILNSIIFPASWSFFWQFQNLTFYFETKLNEYWFFYKSVYHLCYFVYQLIVLFWIFLNLFKTYFLTIKKLRKVLYFAFFVVATIVTPPDVGYQLITSTFIIMIYELLLFHILLKIELSHFN